MMYSSSKDAIKRKMEAVAIEVQANDLGDLDKEEIDDKLRKQTILCQIDNLYKLNYSSLLNITA